MNSKFKIFLLLGVFVFISLRYGTEARNIIGGINNKILTTYVEIKNKFEEEISEHISQREEIVRLRAENQKLQKSAILSIAFAGKLNDLLKENNSTAYRPDISLVKSIGYVNLNDYGKVWIDFKDFDQSRIYGLLHQGYAAGIVVQNDGLPQGLLLSDPKSIFSVYIGSAKMQGVAYGNRKEVLVKYISQWLQPKVGDEVMTSSQWLQPKVGDEVMTSGLDKIFFEGIKVGVVTEVIEEESSKTVVVKPHVTPSVPAYMHIITAQ